MSQSQQPNISVRTATKENAPVCKQICYYAFSTSSLAHGFPCDFPGPEVATGLLSMMFSTAGFYSVVAENGGRTVGSNCLDERSMISVVDPITIDPNAQNLGISRKLMQIVMDRAHEQGAAGIRLVQSAFYNRSLLLYAGLGFDIREPLSCMQGRPLQPSVPGCTVRTTQSADVDACNVVSHAVHGFDRGTELAQAIQQATAKVVERGGRITGYATDLRFFGHATAEANVDLQSLITSAESFGGPGILVPSRNNVLFRWCLSNDLRVVQPMTLMSVGLYHEPAGAWLPSILF